MSFPPAGVRGLIALRILCPCHMSVQRSNYHSNVLPKVSKSLDLFAQDSHVKACFRLDLYALTSACNIRDYLRSHLRATYATICAHICAPETCLRKDPPSRSSSLLTWPLLCLLRSSVTFSNSSHSIRPHRRRLTFITAGRRKNCRFDCSKVGFVISSPNPLASQQMSLFAIR